MTRMPRVAAVAAGYWAAVVLAGGVARGEEEAAAGAAPPPAAAPGRLEPLPPAPVLLEQVMRGLLEAAPGRETLDDVMRRAWARNRQAAEAAQRREFMRQQTQQFENLLQPLLNVELAFVKRACGGLAPQARREVFAAARQAVHDVAERQVRLQFDPDADEDSFDFRRALHEKVAAALEPLAAADEFAAYARESAARRERRETAARLRIVAVLDEQLGLSAAQRRAVLDDLEAQSQEVSRRLVEEYGGMFDNGQPPAPDFVATSIVPHLDPGQARRWRQWAENASASELSGRDHGWSELNMLNQQQAQPGPRKPDTWWQQ